MDFALGSRARHYCWRGPAKWSHLFSLTSRASLISELFSHTT